MRDKFPSCRRSSLIWFVKFPSSRPPFSTLNLKPKPFMAESRESSIFVVHVTISWVIVKWSVGGNRFGRKRAPSRWGNYVHHTSSLSCVGNAPLYCDVPLCGDITHSGDVLLYGDAPLCGDSPLHRNTLQYFVVTLHFIVTLYSTSWWRSTLWWRTTSWWCSSL